MTLSFRQIRILNGVLLGKGGIDSNRGCVRAGPVEKEYAEWLKDELSDVGGRVTRRGDGWKFETKSCDWVKKWRKRWYHKNKKVIPVYISLSPIMGGIWFYNKGSEEPHDRLRFDMNGMRNSIRNGKDMLERAGFDPFESFGDLYLMNEDREDFLEWIRLPRFL